MVNNAQFLNKIPPLIFERTGVQYVSTHFLANFSNLREQFIISYMLDFLTFSLQIQG